MFVLRFIPILTTSRLKTLAFDLNVFRPFISPVVTELLRLIAEVETSECKGRIANCLNTVIERAGLDVCHWVCSFDPDTETVISRSFLS